MDTVQLLGSAMGLGLLAGIRLYATVFALGLAIRLGWFQLGSTYNQLDVLAQTPVLILSGAAFAVEFLADKVPWIDSIWDAIHTFIRPVGAAALGATALGSFDPGTTMMLALLTGGVAFTGHTSKAATRLVANHSPEPFSNVALSLAEDLMVPAGLWVIFEYPLVAIGIVAVFLVLFAWLSPKVFRLLNVSWTALRALMTKFFGRRRQPAEAFLPSMPVAREFQRLPFQPLPENYARKLEGKASTGVHCVATGTVPGLKNSIGYLCATQEELVFVARRMFRLKTYRVRWSEVESAAWRGGVFFDPLTIESGGRKLIFDVFKAKLEKRTEGFSPAWQAR